MRSWPPLSVTSAHNRLLLVLCLFIRTSGTEPKVKLCSLMTVYPVLTKDIDQILLGRPGKGYNVTGHPAWKSRSCSPGRMVGGNQKQLITFCVTAFGSIPTAPYIVAGSIKPSEYVSCFTTQILPFFTASSLTLASIEFFFTL